MPRRPSKQGHCHWCGRHAKRLTIDHVIPQGSGGSRKKSNTVDCCWSCNQARGVLHEIVLGRVSAWSEGTVRRARQHVERHGERDRWLRQHVARIERWFAIWDKAWQDLKSVFGKDAA